MVRSFLNDVGSLLLALSIAIVVWVVATNETNPSREGPFPDAIHIEMVDKPAGLVVRNDFDTQVKLRIRAPQASWERLRPSSFRAYVDLSRLGVGLHEVPVQIECADRQVRILEVTPPRLTLRLEKLESKDLEVRVNILDTAPLGYTFQTPEVTPRRVTVSGPRTLVDRVVEVAVDVAIAGAKSDIERKLTVLAKDGRDNVIEGLDISPPLVMVRLPVEQQLGYKDVSVKAVLKGQVASGYWISNVSVEPSTVTIGGNPNLLIEIPAFLETEPIDVSGAKAGLTKRVGLSLPQGVSLFGVQGVRVKVDVTAIMGGQTIQRELIFQGRGLGLEAVASPEVVDIIISGPVPELQALQPEDVKVILDLTDLKPGTYKLTPQVIVPDYLKVKSIVPDTVEVEITVAPGFYTPTPTSTVTPTATRTPTPRPTSTPTATVTPTVGASPTAAATQ